MATQLVVTFTQTKPMSVPDVNALDLSAAPQPTRRNASVLPVVFPPMIKSVGGFREHIWLI